jgi:hypothetical protein
VKFTDLSPLAIVIVASTVLRLGAALYQGPSIEAGPGVMDELSYHTLAVRVTEGHGFSFGSGWWPATRADTPTAHWSFLYVLLLAALYGVTGPAPLVARLVQATVVGILHPWLVWRIGNRLFGPRVGLASAAIAAVYGYFVYYAGALVTESLYILAVLWAIDIATALACSSPARRAASIRPWLLLGVAAAAATMLRQLFLLMVPAMLAWTAWQLLRRRQTEGGLSLAALAGRVVLPLAVLAVAILPWTMRNYRAFESFVPLNTNAGFVMYWANHPVHGTWFKPILSFGEVNYGTMLPAGFVNMNEAERDRELLRRGLGFVTDDPVRYVRLSLSRAVEFFKFWPSADSSLGSNAVRMLSFGLLLPLTVGGILIVFAQARASGRPVQGAALLLLVAGLYTLVHLLTWTLVRYRLPVDAMTMPLAGVGLVAAVARVRKATDGLRLGASPRGLTADPTTGSQS